MLIKDVSNVLQLPQPSLGLLNAVHVNSPLPISGIQDVNDKLPSVPPVANLVYVNDTPKVIELPAAGAYPARPLYPNEFTGTNDYLFYKVVNRTSNTRQIITCANGVFTSVPINNGITNGQIARFSGFVGTTGFNSEEDYTIVNLEENTFQIQDSQGNLITNASADIAGWVHTYRTNSYYPAHFERVAYSISFNGTSLRIGNSFTLTKSFTFRTVGASSPVLWNVIFEFGIRTIKSTPAPLGPNLAEYEFLPPALEQQIVITDLPSTHSLGINFQKTGKTGLDYMTGKRLIYSGAVNLIPGTYPVTDDFILRIRVGNFDIQDNVASPAGYVAYMISDPLPPNATSAA